MSEPKKRRSAWPVWVGMVIALPVLYVLSLGPACWLAQKRAISARTVISVHRPLLKLLSVCPEWMQRIADWYCDDADQYRNGVPLLSQLRLLSELEDKLKRESAP